MMITTVFSVAIGAFAMALAGTPLVYHLNAWKEKAAHYQDAAAKTHNKYVGVLDERDKLLDKLRILQEVRNKLESQNGTLWCSMKKMQSCTDDFKRELTAARKLLDDCHAQRMKLQEENEHLRKELKLYQAENDNINREIRNILNYDGTERGQERLNG